MGCLGWIIRIIGEAVLFALAERLARRFLRGRRGRR
jgi:hypothetical protein